MSEKPSPEGAWVEPSSQRRFYYHVWQPAVTKSVLVVVHGFGEHGGRYESLANALTSHGILVAVLDLWGHGRSDGVRGEVGDPIACLGPLTTFTEEVVLPAARMSHYAVFGHSFGGLVAAHWLLQAPPTLDRAIIQSPLFEAGFPIPGWKRSAANLLGFVWPHFSLSMNLDVSALSRDSAIGRAYQTDPLVHNHMSAGTYRALLRARDEALARAATIRVPTLFLYGTADRIVSISVAQQWYDRLTCEKRHVAFLEAYHELHHEPIRQQVFELMREWLLPMTSSP